MAIIQQMPPFNNVNANGVATVRIPKYNNALTRMVLDLGGTAFTKAMITDIKVKIGVRTVYNVTGAYLDTINKYKGIYDAANQLTIDFTERDAPSISGKELGGYDMSVLPDSISVEVTITGATAPTLTGFMFLTAPQGQVGALIHKLLYYPTSTTVAGKFPININPQGALIKRMHIFYAGASWAGNGDGNVNRVEVKKNGIVVKDMTDHIRRFVQNEYRKVPQAGHFAVDFIVDNNQSAMLITKDAKSLEFNSYLTAGDTLNCYVEMLDLPYNA
ncbi:major capsid protein P2 [Pandoraea sp. XJJ-1]|uniref:major capsid protein P2 n=1 Tax=Pandoraea sp. XJJ-1 TaxID=3002643 RepID=UPI00227E4D56|nr:major capsid protein P2 [Pandoraea sp. XJJ-1]WAL84961.1 major capsid protein P2 [Pandoraea sp. XJJ-1]